MKIKPPRQAQEWSYSSHRESIGKALSSPGIKSSKKTHINCGSSARMAENWCDQWQASPHMVDSFILHVPPLTYLPASARSCSRRSANDMTDWRRKNSVPGDPIQPMLAKNAFVQVIMMFRKTFIQNSVLMMELHPCYPIWQHSIFSDPAYLPFKRNMLQIEAQEHDPAHTLLQQCVPMH
ncbi:hypothetical protein [Absidia glauca]|uniref:Ndc10 domain-containing protein n=1 Tax=Absidia glauca TaxID=4829 RepID=A0A168L778_ABSGL|nr:hypothetical protein [Absidia glauca]